MIDSNSVNEKTPVINTGAQIFKFQTSEIKIKKDSGMITEKYAESKGMFPEQGLGRYGFKNIKYIHPSEIKLTCFSEGKKVTLGDILNSVINNDVCNHDQDECVNVLPALYFKSKEILQKIFAENNIKYLIDFTTDVDLSELYVCSSEEHSLQMLRIDIEDGKLFDLSKVGILHM
ncbi:MAG: hypothetical protein ACI9AR_000299 [Flavobacteriaceae bacterium]|jgi:hypothetical protein